MLKVYVRVGCHLCDGVRHLLNVHQIAHQLVDIDSDKALCEQYDWLVPVLYHPQKDQELIFPFTESQLLEFAS